MKKQTKSEKIRRAMVIAVASMMVMGMPMVVNAEGEDTEPSESKSSSETSSDSHESKSESSSTSHESSEKASSASSESKKAESSAKESSEKASEASKAASEASESAKSAADSVNSDSKSKDEMSNAASDAKDAVDSAAETVAEKDAEYASSSETKTADSSEDASGTESGSEAASTEESEDVKAAKEITQGLEKAIESIEDAGDSISKKADAATDVLENSDSALSKMKDNFEKVFSDDTTISEDERKEAAEAVIKAAEDVDKELVAAEKAKEDAKEELKEAEKEYNAYAVVYFKNVASWDGYQQEYQESFHNGLNYAGDALANAKAELAKYYSVDERPDLYALLETNYNNMNNSVLTGNKDAVDQAVEDAQDVVDAAKELMDGKLKAYNDAAAECEKQADLARAASEAAAAAAEKAELAYHKAEEAAEDAENAVDADQITDAEKDNIYFAQVDTAKATLEARKQAEEAAAAAKEAEQQRKEVEAALDKQITDAEDTLAKAQENLAMVQRQAYKYDSAKAFGAMLERLTNARKAVAEAEQALKEAKQDAATYQKFANYYLGTDTTSNISTRKITAYAQKNADGTLATKNSYNFDVNDSDVISRSSSLFTQVSEGTIDVPDEIYRLYLKAMIDNQAKLTKNGAGIATGTVTDAGKANEVKGESMPVIYWKVDENNKLTGEYFTDITYQPSGKYFVGYVFKRESDIATRGYHIDGFMVEHEQVVRGYEEIPDVPGNWDPDPKTPNTNPGGGNGGNGGNGGGNPGTTVPVVTITDDPVSLADMIDQAAIEILDGPVALAASVPGDVIIGDEDVPLADSIPQTGDNAVSVLPAMLSGIVAIGAALGLGKKKEEK